MTVRVTTLENGLRVITDPMTSVETASVGVWVEVGARHEHPEVNGVSHLLEHMAFKGTERRNARQIAEEIEAVGGQLNAYTSREQTAFFAKTLKEDLGLAVDILSDIIRNPTLEADELERERAVILQEIHQCHDTPDDVIFDHFQATAFPGQPLGRPVLGSVELIRDMERETVVDFMRGHYNGNRMVLSAAGAVDHDQVVAMARERLGDTPEGNGFDRQGAAYKGGDFRESRDLEQVHLVFGFEGLPYHDDDFYAASVLSTLFGGGMSSRLFQEARENRGLVYSIYTFVSCYSDGGVFGIYAGTGQDETEELIPLVCDECKKVADKVHEDEVKRARAQLKANVLMSLESSSSRCEQRARQLTIYGRPIPMDELVEKIEAVDTEAVRRVAERFFASVPTFAAMGPLGRVEDYDGIAKRLA